ncbi:MAG: TonB-dependent receptor [Bacteroidota bacterium]|nr:TonB-dependent receptor [Bacteroidota bacterium]
MKIILHYILLSCLALSQGEWISVSGKIVSSEDGNPIIGATVLVQYSTIGTSSDNDGTFFLKHIPASRKTLSISAVGFKTVTVTLTNEEKQEQTIQLTPSPVQTQDVVVTASKRAQSLEEVPVSMSIVDAKSFSDRNIVSVDDALRYVPGVNFQQTQINIRASSGYSRGAGSRVSLLIDGMPLLAGDTGEITFESIPVFQIERVEVVKGAGSTLYGSGALGGVVNVLTKDIPEHPLVWWRLYGGFYSPPVFDEWKWSDKTRFTNGQYAGFTERFGRLGIAFSLHRVSDDGYRDNDWLRRYSGYVKMKYDFSPYQSVTVSTNIFQQYRGDFLWWKDVKNALHPAEGQQNATVTSLRANSSILYKHFVSEDFYFDIKAIHFRSNWYRDSLSTKRLDESISDAIVLDVQGVATVNQDNTLTAGLVWNGERIRSNIFGGHDGQGGAIYAQDEHKFSTDLSIVGGVRYDVQRVIGLQTNQQVNPKLGIRYHVAEGIALRSSLGRGFRSPSVSEYYTSTANTGSAAIVVSNTTLKPEHSWTYEIGMVQNYSGHMTLDMALYQSDFSDLIDASVGLDSSISKSAAVIQFKNITQARIQGFEMSCAANFLDQAVQWNVNYNYNWAVDRDTKTFLRFRPRHSASTNISYKYDLMTVGADFRYSSRIEQIDDKLVQLAPIMNGDERVPVYLLDVRINTHMLDLGLPMTLGFTINNLLGYNYVELIGNMAPPRSFVLSVEGML